MTSKFYPKNGLKSSFFFCQESQIFCTFGLNFASMWSKCISNIVLNVFRFPESAFATVARKTLNGKLNAKNYFPIGHFMLLLLTLAFEV